MYYLGVERHGPRAVLPCDDIALKMMQRLGVLGRF